jgi:hypothetical protein
MKDAALIKIVSISGSVIIVCVMLAKDGNVALAAAATLLATLSGLGGAAIMASKKVV